MPNIKLNAEQRRAVEYGEGPLLIVAGAGTGKTRVLIERVGHLLSEVKGLKPENILALTFSRKAASEMRQRAAERFGSAAAGARFSTFHSFCNDLIGSETDSRPLDKIDQWIFLRRNLDKLDLDHYFKVSNPGQFLSDLVDFASRCHDNLVSPGDYNDYVHRLAVAGPPLALAEPEAIGSKQRKPKKVIDPVAEFEAELKRQREVARVYQLLEEMQEQQNYLSYGAMISRAVRLLDDSPELLSRLRAEFRFILVDEFQDTNTAQFELLRRLAGEPHNITVVGDDDQAIYRFRGASFASFDQFREQFAGHARVVLDRNYRSTDKILSVAGSAISRNKNRYLPDKKLIASRPAGPQVEVWEFANEHAQARHTADEIARSVTEAQANSTGVDKVIDYSSFAVLYRAHAHRQLLVNALRERGIPFAIRGLAINDLPVVRDLIAFLRVIGDSQDSVSMARVLRSFARSSRWNMPDEVFAECCKRASRERISLSLAASKAAWTGCDDFTKFLLCCRQRATEVRVAAWFPLLADDIGLPRAESERTPLKTFREFFETWNEEKCETGLLEEFLEYFGYFEEAGGRITLPDDEEPEFTRNLVGGKRGRSEPAAPAGGQTELFAAGELAGESISSGGAAEASKYPLGRVQLMTIHASKGLEFDHVFAWRLVRRSIPTANRKPLIALPEELWKGALPTGDYHLEEERRLFYVALTRARESLTLVTVSNEASRPSPFVDDLRDVPPSDLVWTRPIVSPVLHAALDRVNAATQSLPLGLVPRREDATRPVSLSISQLESYLDCPLKYYFGYVLQIPVPAAPALLFGTVMHAAAREVVRLVCEMRKDLSDLEVEAILNQHWDKVSMDDSLQEAKYREQGMAQLKQLRDAWKERKIKLLHQEKPFEMQFGGCRVTGRIDQVHRNEAGEVELLEFKTGRPKTQKETDEMRQLTLYAEACRKVLGVKPEAIALCNLTGQELLHTSRSADELIALEDEFKDAHQRISAESFPAQPGFMTCRNCAYRPICPQHEQRDN
ncbi:MAG: ATP-dependent helicase [Acidobacteria bacterium]|nr:ATP-dependent helicase [Acidobacteriota bacterium]